MAKIVSLQANVSYGSHRERCIDGGFVSLSCVCFHFKHLSVAYQWVFIVLLKRLCKAASGRFLCDHVHLLANSLHSLLAFFFLSIYCEHMILYTKEPLHPLWAGSCTSWFRTRVSYAVLYITFRWHLFFFMNGDIRTEEGEVITRAARRRVLKWAPLFFFFSLSS